MSKLNTKKRENAIGNLSFKLREAISLFGEDVIFLPCYPGTKRPMIRSWQKLTSDIMRDPEHLEKLATAVNFSVVTGIASGGVISIDIDTDEEAEAFLERNPQLRPTFRTKGRRGWNIWVRILGRYPEYSSLKLDGKAWGEFRSHNHHTVIWGRHPDGMFYKWLMTAPPLIVTFESIVWPEGLEWATSSNPVKVESDIGLLKHCQDGKEGKDGIDGTDGVDVVCGCLCDVLPAGEQFTLESILQLSMPGRVHDTHSRIFQLARGVITLEQQKGTKFSIDQLDGIFDRWHAAVPPEWLTGSKDDYCDEFLDAYQDAKHPLGGLSLQMAFEKAKIEPMPAAALRFKDPKKQLMVAILFQLQLAAGNEPIFLPVLKAEKLLGVPARTCTYWLSGLVARGLLEIVLEADRIRRRATRYRFVAMAEKEKS